MATQQETKPDLRQKAIETLKLNDHGGYTVPTASGLYPAQWNWDSCLVSLGFSQFDSDRAWVEIETLFFKCQWPDGMVPHITFHEDDSTYFPNSAVWQAGHDDVKTSGITQPAVAATVLRYLSQRDAPNLKERLKAIVPKVLQYHRWFYMARDPNSTGLVSILHPWESGMDNSPIWDAALKAVEPGPSVAHLRKDTGFAHSSMRPTGPEYDRYINLVIGYRNQGFDPKKLYHTAPFLVADVGFNAILQRANHDLVYLLREIGDGEGAKEIEGHIVRTGAAIEACWDAEDGIYYGRDTRNGNIIKKPGIAGFLPLYADPTVATRHPELIKTLQHWLSLVPYGVPSFAPDRPEFEPLRYWRGPVWLVVNWMILDGLADNGQKGLSKKILNDSLALVDKDGFGEYFDPTTGKSLGGGNFSWTAAMYLFFKSLGKN